MKILSRIIAFMVIIAISPLLLTLCILCLLFQGRPIFYSQIRIGYKFKPFMIYKFRSMSQDSSIKINTSNNNPQITPWGRFMRKFKFDELPQLYNILKGDMRFIGPRPELPDYVIKTEFRFLNKFPPGLSDYSSILLIDESSIISSDFSYSDLLKLKNSLANYYVTNKSFVLDLKLVFLTMIAVIFPRFVASNFIMPIVSKIAPEWEKKVKEKILLAYA